MSASSTFRDSLKVLLWPMPKQLNRPPVPSKMLASGGWSCCFSMGSQAPPQRQDHASCPAKPSSLAAAYKTKLRGSGKGKNVSRNEVPLFLHATRNGVTKSSSPQGSFKATTRRPDHASRQPLSPSLSPQQSVTQPQGRNGPHTALCIHCPCRLQNFKTLNPSSLRRLTQRFCELRKKRLPSSLPSQARR